jgi:3-hydroxy-9,10-secoandrosta-1,3,5(10)-triene-9,17-dione monooxygenase
VALQVANNPQVQARIGWASATIESARALLVASLRAAEAKLRAGEALSVDERIVIRRNQAFAARQSVLVVNELFAREGTAAAAASAPLQRFWRDANVAALHASLDWDGVSAMYGQQQLGVEPQGSY